MDFLTLTGESCFAPWEAQKLTDRLNKLGGDSKVSSIKGTWVYFASIKGDATSAQQKLQQLLPLPTDPTPDISSLAVATGNSQKCFIAPRNESPWSSKATSIAQVCGYGDQIRRIERGRVVVVEFEAEGQDKPAFDNNSPFWNVLFDRMTETLGSEYPDLGVMFGEGEPRPLEVVDIFAAGQDPVAVLQAYNEKHGLALAQDEMEYLVKRYTELGYVIGIVARTLAVRLTDLSTDVHHMTSSFSCSAKSTRSTVVTSCSTRTGPSTERPRARLCSK
jgi:phosphoribosylformylglycinamidine synthase